MADRITRAIEADAEEPLARASMGIAVYPRDGDRLEALISAADRGLYAEKARRRLAPPPRASAPTRLPDVLA